MVTVRVQTKTWTTRLIKAEKHLSLLYSLLSTTSMTKMKSKMFNKPHYAFSPFWSRLRFLFRDNRFTTFLESHKSYFTFSLLVFLLLFNLPLRSSALLCLPLLSFLLSSFLSSLQYSPLFSHLSFSLLQTSLHITSSLFHLSQFLFHFLTFHISTSFPCHHSFPISHFLSSSLTATPSPP